MLERHQPSFEIVATVETMRSELCFCGERAAGWCVRCSEALCRSHVATRLPLREWGEYEAWTVGHARRRPLTALGARAASTLQALRIELNDLWVCDKCLQLAEDVSLALETENKRPLLFDLSADPLSNLLHGVDESTVKSYSRAELHAATAAEINRGGGARSLCKKIGVSAYQSGSPSLYHWNVGLIRKQQIQVVSVGRLQCWTSAGNGDRGDQGPTTFDERLVVDNRGQWLTLPRYRFSNAAPGYTVLPLDEIFLQSVALDVARGHTKRTYDSRSLQQPSPPIDEPPLPMLEAVIAGREFLRHATA